MIVSLRGTVIASGRDNVVLEVNGIGYQVFTPDPHLVPLNSQAFLHTVLIVRDDGLSLYGFPESIGSELFRNLLRVGGIGPAARAGHPGHDEDRQSAPGDPGRTS